MIGADGVVFVHFIHVDGFTSFHVITSLCSRKWFTSFTKLIRFAHVRFSHFRTTGAIFVEDYLRRQWRSLFVPLALFFVGHDVEDEVVGDFHAIVTDASEVADSAVDIIFHDAFGGVGVGVLHCQIRAEDSRSHSTGNLQCATRFGTVANHTRYIGNHILDGVGNLLVVAAHEVGDTCCRTCGSHHATAQGRQTSERLFDVNNMDERHFVVYEVRPCFPQISPLENDAHL